MADDERWNLAAASSEATVQFEVQGRRQGRRELYVPSPYGARLANHGRRVRLVAVPFSGGDGFSGR